MMEELDRMMEGEGEGGRKRRERSKIEEKGRRMEGEEDK